MTYSLREMARLGELLDEAMTLTPEQRFVWLDSLPQEDQPLVKALRESLLSDDPASAIAGALDRMPSIEAAAVSDGGRIDRHAGERLGAYELLRPLGSGGMAEVWLANRADGAFERQVALKIPHLRNLPAQMTDRFARECRILATLETPNIARLYDAGVDADGAPYIAMEYVQGEPLVDWCNAKQVNLTNVAFAWLLSKPIVTSVIAGAVKIEQIDANARAAEFKLRPEDVAELDKLTAPALATQPH